MFCKSILKILQIASFLIFVYATTKKGLIVVAIDYIDFDVFSDTQIDIFTCSALAEIMDCYGTNLEEEIKQYTDIADAITTGVFNFRHIVMSHIINYFANGMPERDDYESILLLNEKCYDEDWKQKFVAKIGNNTERIDNNYVRRLIYCYVTAADKFRKSKIEFLGLYREAQKAKIRDLISLKQNYGHTIIFINKSTHLEILKSIYEYSIANPGTILDSVQVYLDTTLLSVDILLYIFNEAAVNAIEGKKHNGIQGFVDETIKDYIKQLRNTDGFAANVANTYRRILVHDTRFVLFSNFLFAYIEVFYFMSITFGKPHNYTIEEAKNCLTGIYKTIQHKYCAYIDSERRIMLGLQKIENRAYLQIINNNTSIF